MPEPAIIVFLKAPRSESVKTRLARDIGEKAATEAYIKLCDILFKKLSPLPNLEIRFTPDDAKPEIAHWLQKGWKSVAQGAGNLGERMNRSIEETAKSAIIIGSDCPYLELQDLNDAAAALRSHDVVIGPATDGGYWLIGLNTPFHALFQKVNWGTSTVLEETMAIAEAYNLTTKLGRELSDIDTSGDWEKFRLNS